MRGLKLLLALQFSGVWLLGCTLEIYDQSARATRCGDGVVERGEVCDDGNRVSGDGCSADCKSTEVCGNGLIDVAAGEVCDDGNRVSGDGCSADCKSTEVCGNGLVDVAAGERCDTGGPSATCNANCTISRCGDGILNVFAGEVCDDGNLIDGDGCESNCTPTP